MCPVRGQPSCRAPRYDNSGNRLQQNGPGGITFYRWDEDSRLSAAEPPAGPVTFS